MNSQYKMVDRFQLFGFAISVAISIILIAIKKDTILSVTLGLLTGILTQLFDLQIRNKASEERLLQANVLNPIIYHNQWLFEHIDQIANDYVEIETGWFELFKHRAKEVIVDCQIRLHSMANGYLLEDVQNPFTLTFETEAPDSATTSIKAAAAGDLEYWKSPQGEKYLQANTRAVRRGVKVTRVFIQKPNALKENVDILENQKELGIDIHITFIDDIPRDYYESFLILDDSVVNRIELTADGFSKREKISINQVEVERMVRRFDILMENSKSLGEVIGNLT